MVDIMLPSRMLNDVNFKEAMYAGCVRHVALEKLKYVRETYKRDATQIRGVNAFTICSVDRHSLILL